MSAMYDEHLSPETSPTEIGKLSGVRRVNNVPIIIILVIALAFLIIMAWEGLDRAANRQSQVSEIKKPEDTFTLAETVAGLRPEGIVEPEKIPVPQPNLNANAKIIQSSDVSTQPNNFIDADEQRIRESKNQLFETAVRSKSTVQFTEASLHSTLDNQRGEILNKIDDAKVRLASIQKDDPSTVFKNRLNEMQSGAGSITSASLSEQSNSERNNLNQFSSNKEDKWDLNSKMDIPKTPYVLRAGFVIPAIMISGINSDLPGQIIGQVSQNVYDTASGKYLLIPQGTRLVGSYSSDVSYGQSRVFIAWQRLVFPDGKALDIGAMPGADGLGYAGLTDKVDNHYLRIFGSAILMSGITAGASYSQDNGSSGSIYARPTASSELSAALGQQLGNTTSQIITKNLNIAPTLEIEPGFRFNVMSIKDMTFTKPYKSFDYQKGAL